MGDSILKKELIDHYKSPRNWGEMKDPTVTGTAINDLCGDDLKVYMKIKNDQIQQITYTGNGCAICLGTMSIFTEQIKGKMVQKVKGISEEDILDRIGMEKTSSRKRCATLTMEAIDDALMKV